MLEWTIWKCLAALLQCAHSEQLTVSSCGQSMKCNDIFIVGLCWLSVNRAVFIALYILFVTVMISLLHFGMHVCIMICFLCASTKCCVWVMCDCCDALQLTRPDSVRDAVCIAVFWTFLGLSVTSVYFMRNALFFTIWVDFCHWCIFLLYMYTHQVTFDSSSFSTSHFSSAFSLWFVVLFYSP